MLMDFKYESSSGEVIALNDARTVVGTPLELLGASWDYQISNGGAVSGAARTMRSLNLVAAFVDAAEADHVYEVLDGDMAQGLGGVLHSGKWSQRAIVTGATVKKLKGGAVEVQFAIRLLDGFWQRVTKFALTPGSADDSTTTGLDYPTDFPFDYAGTSRSNQIASVSSGGCSVRVTFFGPCVNPYVRIGSNVYAVNYTAGTGERIVIDPTKRRVVGGSIYLVGAFGEKTNLYDRRQRGTEGSGSYVFQRLPSGNLPVSWPQSYGVTLELIEERGALPWS